MEKTILEQYWVNIPVGKENAVTYDELRKLWDCTDRRARSILHELSSYDNGDNYILIRSARCKGFYKTDDESEIAAYKRECLNKGRSIFAPVKKINRVLSINADQYSLINNMRVVRESKGFRQSDVCRYMKQFDRAFDKSLLSKMENGVCMPTYYQLAKLAVFFDCMPSDLLQANLYYETIQA